MTTDWTENTRALKILIWVMTTLLVVGMVALFVGMAKTASEIPAATAPLVVGSGPVDLRNVVLPKGSEIRQVAAGNGQLLLWLATRDGDLLLVLDPASGKELARYRLVAE